MCEWSVNIALMISKCFKINHSPHYFKFESVYDIKIENYMNEIRDPVEKRVSKKLLDFFLIFHIRRSVGWTQYVWGFGKYIADVLKKEIKECE